MKVSFSRSIFIFFLLCVSFFFQGCLRSFPPQTRSRVFEEFLRPKFPQAYYIQKGVFTEKQIRAIHKGFKNWEPIIQELSATSFTFKFMGFSDASYNIYDNIHIVRMAELDSNVLGLGVYPFTKKTYGFFAEIPGGDILINQNFRYHTEKGWTLADVLNFNHPSYCLERLVTHEVGHLIGLEHVKNKEDVMYPSVSSRSTRSSPSEGDIMELERVYIKYLKNFDVFNF
ncbi:MAG: matrixin family metalloprotease [Deltaproteobacteria bacterium]|nr:matrixin family metalloprotease [Deltaproteobacteria bacterium]